MWRDAIMLRHAPASALKKGLCFKAFYSCVNTCVPFSRFYSFTSDAERIIECNIAVLLCLINIIMMLFNIMRFVSNRKSASHFVPCIVNLFRVNTNSDTAIVIRSFFEPIDSQNDSVNRFTWITARWRDIAAPNKCR